MTLSPSRLFKQGVQCALAGAERSPATFLSALVDWESQHRHKEWTAFSSLPVTKKK